jgi:phosphopantothenoylcysteine decarboxylase/phosphopantothenate--cysteine ligase
MPYGAEVIPVESALDMAEAVLARAPEADVIIGAAAVADYRVAVAETRKIKRKGEPLVLTLTENPDILAQAGHAKHKGQIIVGFAAETDDLLRNATAKLEKKNLDLIVANQVGTSDSNFGTDTIKAAFIAAGGHVEDLPLLTKEDLAEQLMDRIASLFVPV